MLKSPLKEFAERLIRNGEVKKFIKGLVDKGVDPVDIVNAVGGVMPSPPR